MNEIKETITVAEAAARMGTSPEHLRWLIREQKVPFGLTFPTGSITRYIIPRGRFEAWVNGADLAKMADTV